MTDDGDGRHARQILFPPIGAEGQRRIGAATVGVLGLGALGATLAELCVRAGVGRLIAADRDVIERSNLHRQGLYSEADARDRLPKAVAAARALAAIDAGVVIETHVAHVDAENVGDLFGGCDLLLDGTDGFDSRYLLNDFAIDRGIPWIYGACIAASGMTATIVPGETPCLACLFPEPPEPGTQETCDTAGIIAPAARVVAALQIAEALKLLVGARDVLRRSLLSIELWPFRLVELGGAGSRPRADCRACGKRDLQWLRSDPRLRAVSLCGRDSVQVTRAEPLDLDLETLARRVGEGAVVARNRFSLTLRQDAYTLTLFPDGRALVRGTTDVGTALAVLGRILGA